MSHGLRSFYEKRLQELDIEESTLRVLKNNRTNNDLIIARLRQLAIDRQNIENELSCIGAYGIDTRSVKPDTLAPKTSTGYASYFE